MIPRGSVKGLSVVTTGLAIYLFVSICFSTTYYVSVSGNDIWSGRRPDSAWRHINRACTTVVAGDSVLVLAGTYGERTLFRRSGTAGQPIVFKSEPRRTATTWGFDTNTPAAGSYTKIEGFNITWDTSLTGQRNNGIFISSNNVEVVDNYLYNLRYRAIQGNMSQPYTRNVLVANNRIFHSQSGIGAAGVNWRVESNEVERLFMYGNGDCDYSRFFGDTILFWHNYFHGTDHDSIGSAHVDCFQTFDDNGEHACYITIDANRGFDYAQGVMADAQNHHNTHDFVIKNNLFARGWAWGVFTRDIPNVMVYNNTFACIGWHGVGFSGPYSQGGVVRNNIFFNTTTSYRWTDSAQASGDYNLIYGASQPTRLGPHDIMNQYPQFVDTLNNDFRLRATSPAIDRGDSLLQVPVDIVGVPRPQQLRWDVGAYEYVPTQVENRALTYRWAVLTFKCHPNPVADRVTIAYGVNRTCRVRLRVFDTAGRLVCVLVDCDFEQGTHLCEWSLKDHSGRRVSKGVYILNFEAGNSLERQKIIVVK